MFEAIHLPKVIERILVHAIAQHDDPSDQAGLLEYARVLPRALAPSIDRALLMHSTYLSLDAATARGDFVVLNKWAALGVPLECPREGLKAAIYARHLAVLEWWPASGAFKIDDAFRHLLEQCGADGKIFVAFGVRPIITDIDGSDAGSVVFPGNVLPVDADFDQICANIAAGSVDELLINEKRISTAGIDALNAAMASPNQVLESVKISSCTLDLPRLLALRLPSSLRAVDVDCYWLGDLPLPRPAQPTPVPWPVGLTSLTLTDLNFSPVELMDVFPYLLGSLPATLEELELSRCPLDDAAAQELARARLVPL
ncbi:hypothetical protein H9P43_007577 [Blastocladiella emersonii ATCC 22665]|nr:hypothetical protein H9P43_007577 [Blastocladiella emersonii ATCC 22665]